MNYTFIAYSKQSWCRSQYGHTVLRSAMCTIMLSIFITSYVLMYKRILAAITVHVQSFNVLWAKGNSKRICINIYIYMYDVFLNR